MAIAVFFDGKGQSIEKYDESIEIGGDEVRHQPARRSHVCWQTEDGFGVLDVWESEEDFGKFGDLLGPILEKVGLTMQPQVFPLHNTL
jgi:hypothetical protein